MRTVAALFPGQGSQTIGMGRFAFENFKAAKDAFEEASDAIKLNLMKLCFEGDDATLALTENTQPALLTTSVATFRALHEACEPRVAMGAGHSVGEFAAMVCAGAMELGAAARAVRARGQAMQEAVPVGKGAMLAVLGLADEQIEQMLGWARAHGMPGVLEPANYNAPGQVVVSGSAAAVEWLKTNLSVDAFAPQTPRFKLIPLNVSAPFHCSLMKPAELRMSEVLAATPMRDADWDVVQNVTAQPERAAETLRKNLVQQVSGAVLWTQSVRRLRTMGASICIEYGAGKVLAGLSKKIDSDNLTTLNTNSLDDFRLIERAFSGRADAENAPTSGA